MSHQQRLKDEKPEWIPMHLFVLGNDIPYAAKLLKHYDRRNRYEQTTNYLEYTEALSLSHINVFFMNIPWCDFTEMLDANESLVLARRPLLVAAAEYRKYISPATIAKYDIRFVPFYMAEDPGAWPKEIQGLLQQRGHEGRS